MGQQRLLLHPEQPACRAAPNQSSTEVRLSQASLHRVLGVLGAEVNPPRTRRIHYLDTLTSRGIGARSLSGPASPINRATTVSTSM
jgi:hypothetical protein